MSDLESLYLEKSKSGDIEAFEMLIDGYQKKVYNIALRMIGSREDASDMAQEVFIRIFRSLKNFKGQSSFSTWVYRITVNVCLDELRRAKNRKVISLDEDIKADDSEIKRQVEDDRPTPEVIIERDEVKRIVNEAIDKLAEEHKAVIVLRDIHGFSYEEIAQIIKCPEGTVKSRINRARKSLKEILEPKRELLFEGYVK